MRESAQVSVSTCQWVSVREGVRGWLSDDSEWGGVCEGALIFCNCVNCIVAHFIYTLCYCMVAWLYGTLLYYTIVLLCVCTSCYNIIAWLYTTLLYCSVIVYYKISYFNVYINFVSELAAIILLFSVIINCGNGNFPSLKFRHRPFTGILTGYGWFAALFVTVLTSSINKHAPRLKCFSQIMAYKIKNKSKAVVA
jgi:hypothetical protein